MEYIDMELSNLRYGFVAQQYEDISSFAKGGFMKSKGYHVLSKRGKKVKGCRKLVRKTGLDHGSHQLLIAG
jgi:hypothetical protein